jgi:hypothetical protein
MEVDPAARNLIVKDAATGGEGPRLRAIVEEHQACEIGNGQSRDAREAVHSEEVNLIKDDLIGLDETGVGHERSPQFEDRIGRNSGLTARGNARVRQHGRGWCDPHTNPKHGCDLWGGGYDRV